jgi:uncharacterized protein YraI
MKRLLAFATGVLLLTAVQPAKATDGWTSVGINLRQGPATSYGVVIVVPACAKITYDKCEYGWCHTYWNAYEGYLSDKYILHSACSYRPPAPSYSPPSTGYKPPPPPRY